MLLQNSDPASHEKWCGPDGWRESFSSPSGFPFKPSPTVAPLSTMFWAGLLGLEIYPGRHRLTQCHNGLLCDLDRRVCHELGVWSLADPGMWRTAVCQPLYSQDVPSDMAAGL